MTSPLMRASSLLIAAYLQLAGGVFFYNVFRIINKLITGYYITMATWQLVRKKQVAQLPWGLSGTKVIVDFFSASLCLASLFFSSFPPPLFLLFPPFSFFFIPFIKIYSILGIGLNT